MPGASYGRRSGCRVALAARWWSGLAAEREEMVMRRLLPRFGLLVGLAVLASSPAHAQAVNVLDTIVSQFQTRAAGWEGTLTTLATQTFGILAAIELAWAAFRLAFRGADVSEWLAEIVNQILFLGFFLALLQNASTWGTAIVNSFRQAGQAAGGVGVAPSDVFAAGVNLAQKVLDHMSKWDPAASVALVIAAIVIEVCFALIAAWMVVTLVQSYIVIAAGVITMAFGGSRWTKDIAVATIRYTVSVGAKLMMLQLLVSIGQSIITSWADQFSDLNNQSLMILIGCSIVMVAVVKILPDEFQKVVGGASMSSGSALVGAAAAVGGAVGGVALGMAGAPAMAASAFQLASAQMGAADAKAAEANGGQAPERSRIARAAALTGGTAKNLAMAPIRDVGRRLTGDIGARHGVATWRMAADMANKRRLLSDDNNKPSPPPPPGASGNSIS
jgi:type IV secretion system protein TrbL